MESERTADEVFRLLADESRLGILKAIAIAQHENKETGVAELSFSEIYDRVDVDNTSKLSYHLGELVGTFLRKHDDAYAFTHAGEQLVRFILAENYRPPPDLEAIETEGCCLHCGETALQAMLHDQYFVIQCSICDRPAFTYRITPAQVRSHTDLIEAVSREQTGDFLKMRRGVCPDCAGRITTSVIETTRESIPESPVSFGTSSACRQCLRFLSVPLTHAAAYHPESVAFHWDHGVDILGAGVWEFHRYLHDGRWTTDRIDTNPAEYRVTFQSEAASLQLYLDENAVVMRTERARHREYRDDQN